ncbi:MAG: hypothetical protein Q6373_025780 [Candidatus Sigynarchaeota archaeon]
MVKSRTLRRVIAFTCTGNQAICMMAAGVAFKNLHGVSVILAAVPPGIDTLECLQNCEGLEIPFSTAVQVMDEIGIDISSIKRIQLDERIMNTITHLVLINREDQDSCVIPGLGKHRRRVPMQVREWHVEEPTSLLESWRKARTEIEWRVRVLQKELEIPMSSNCDLDAPRSIQAVN